MRKLHRSEEEWKENLSPEEYRVCRMKGTEVPFSGEYVDFDEEGHYVCKCCGEPLFNSSDKFDAHCGWPSFSKAANEENIEEHLDSSHGMERVEITCRKCGAHLGHVFPDGPTPTGLRYCVNSVSIKFKKERH